MRSVVLLAFALLISSGCGKPAKPTEAPPASPAEPDPKIAPAPRAADGPPWSEGTANAKIVGLTDDEVTALLGKPKNVAPHSDGSAKKLWRYDEKKWLKPDPQYPQHTTPTGMFVVMDKGRAVGVLRIAAH